MSHTHYVIDRNKLQVLGRFLYEVEAIRAIGELPCSVVSDGSSIEKAFSHWQITQIYNALTGSKIKGFHTKREGAAKLAQVLEQHKDAISPNPVIQKPKGKKISHKSTQPKEEITMDPRHKEPYQKGAVAKVWELADTLHRKGEASRKKLLQEAQNAGINLNTAKCQWQAWRKARGL